MADRHTGRRKDASEQVGINARAWTGGRFVRSYESDDLRPAEAWLIETFAGDVAGRVLELGCGAGRLTGHLARVARELHAIDISPDMLDAARRRHPGATYHLGDIADLSTFADRSFDAIVGTCNVIDVFDDATRRKLLADLRRLLVPGGLLAFSSHNRAYADKVQRPWQLDTSSPRALAADVYHLPHHLANHLRLQRREVETATYRLVNDPAHGWVMLLYYIDPEDQFRQLEELGYTALQCVDEAARPVGPDHPAADDAELLYLARPA